MFKKLQEAIFVLEKEEGMRVPGLVIATEKLIQDPQIQKALDQVKNVAYLPGIVNYSIAMPDIHWGYGFPIGGVAAMDVDEGVISPGGVGYDINCGVRLALIPEKFKNIPQETQKRVLHEIFRLVPSGVGHGHREERGLTNEDYEKIAKEGVNWSINQGYGFVEDAEHIESKGVIDGADMQYISDHAKERGRKQLGSIGSGNHFIEIGEVQKILDQNSAEAWHIYEGQTYVLIHSGSRGFGHQVCQDTLNQFIRKGYAKNLPDRQLVAAPIKSVDGERYFQAMAAAANYAFNNRQRILHYVREAFKTVMGISPKEVKLLYDVCHNIAKFEEHVVDGKLKTLCVHRKGATRAFGPGAKELAKNFQKTGQPVLVPGDMGSASYLMRGLGNTLTWGSCCHGAGRSQSRTESMKEWRGKNLKEIMQQRGVIVEASSYSTIAEEMPNAYKDIDEVVGAVELASCAKKVVKLRPCLVCKG